MSDAALDFEIVVVGAGPAGPRRGLRGRGKRPHVSPCVDDTPWLGGQIWRGQRGVARTATGPRSQQWFGTTFRIFHAVVPRQTLRAGTSRDQRTSPIPSALWFERFRECGLLDRTTMWPRRAPALAEHESPRQIRWQKLILATGARELFLPFPGWTLPGVMGPGGLQSLPSTAGRSPANAWSWPGAGRCCWRWPMVCGSTAHKLFPSPNRPRGPGS